MTPRNTPRLCFIGFGEAGQAIASGLRDTGIETSPPGTSCFPPPRARTSSRPARAMGVRGCKLRRRCGARRRHHHFGGDGRFEPRSRRSVEPHLTGHPYFLDINSVSPGRKKETEKLLGGKARYVDVAILAPIDPARHQTPLLLAGPHAEP